MLMKQVHAKILVAIFILSALIGAQLATPGQKVSRSEEHTSELQSRLHLVCRLLLEKKKVFHHHRGERCGNGARHDYWRGASGLDRRLSQWWRGKDRRNDGAEAGEFFLELYRDKRC